MIQYNNVLSAYFKNFTEVMIMKDKDSQELSLQEINQVKKPKHRKSTLRWEKMYSYALKYYKHHGDLEVPKSFKTNDGFTFDKNGTINLGRWIYYQRRLILKGNEREQLLALKSMLYQYKEKALQMNDTEQEKQTITEDSNTSSIKKQKVKKL